VGATVRSVATNREREREREKIPQNAGEVALIHYMCVAVCFSMLQ